MTPPRRSTCPGPTMSSSVSRVVVAPSSSPPEAARWRSPSPAAAEPSVALGVPAQTPRVHADADERVPVGLRRLLRPGGLPGRRGRRGRPDPRRAPGRGHRQRGLPRRRRADRPPGRLPPALLDGAHGRRPAALRPPGRPRALRRRGPHPRARHRQRQPCLRHAGRQRTAALALRHDPYRRRRLHRAPRDPLARRGRGERGAVRGACDDPRRRMAARPVIFGGDVNRRRPCAPPASGPAPTTPPARPRASSTSTAARVLRSPAAHVVPAMCTDHDVLVIRARAV